MALVVDLAVVLQPALPSREHLQNEGRMELCELACLLQELRPEVQLMKPVSPSP